MPRQGDEHSLDDTDEFGDDVLLQMMTQLESQRAALRASIEWYEKHTREAEPLMRKYASLMALASIQLALGLVYYLFISKTPGFPIPFVIINVLMLLIVLDHYVNERRVRVMLQLKKAHAQVEQAIKTISYELGGIR